MTNLTNYHSHCLYCDGRANMEDFIRFAISEGLLPMASLPMPRCRFPLHGLWNGTEWKIIFPNSSVSKRNTRIR